MHRNTVITIGRQYGSGARSIAKELARQLDIPYYDKELLAIAAEQSGLSREVLEHRDEKPSETFYFSSWNMPMYHPELPLGQQIFLAQFHAIREVASRGGCVIVGRCADYLLRNRKNNLNIYIYAPYAYRLNVLVNEHGMTTDEAKHMILSVDKARNNYHKKYAGYYANDEHYQDLMINASMLPKDDIADLIVNVAKRKFGIQEHPHIVI